MNKKDCKIGMFVTVMQNINSVAKNRKKAKKIGKIVGIYNDFVSLLIFKSNTNNKIAGKGLYKETFRYSEIFKIEKDTDDP